MVEFMENSAKVNSSAQEKHLNVYGLHSCKVKQRSKAFVQNYAVVDESEQPPWC